MRLAGRALLLVALAIVTTACARPTLQALAGTEWRAVQVDDVVPVPTPAPRIAFSAGGAFGNGWCSNFTITNLTIDSSATPPRLAFSSLTSSTGGCLNDDWQRADTAFRKALEQATSIDIVAGRLVIDGPGGRIVFEGIPAAS